VVITNLGFPLRIFGSIHCLYKLNKFYPNETFIQYSQHILGQIPGKVVGFIYLFFYLYVGGQALRGYGDFIVATFLNKPPIIIVMGGLILATAFAVRADLEVLARLSDMFFPILFLLWLLIVLLLLQN
jgi:spore germination protein KB